MKLSLEALKERADGIASQELLETISGGLEESCHDSSSGNFGRDGDGNIPTDFKSK
jgi:hypothetical protein